MKPYSYRLKTTSENQTLLESILHPKISCRCKYIEKSRIKLNNIIIVDNELNKKG